jgi:hypothetical protein
MKATRLERIDDSMFTTLDREELAQMVGGQTTYIGTGPVTDPLPHRPGDRADTLFDVA